MFCSWGVGFELEGPPDAVQSLLERIPRGPGQVDAKPLRFRWQDQSWWLDERRLPDLEKTIELEIAQRAPEHVFVHAGVVRWGAAALLLPGESMAGKSTLVRELTARGALYYSDEFAVLDRDGLVHPYPRPLALRSGERLAARSLGWRAELEPVPVGWVLDCRYRGTDAWHPLSRAEAVLALFAHAVAARSKPEAILRILGLALKGATALQGVRGEAGTAVDRILTWIGKE